MKKTPPVHQIELRVAKLSELFNSMDPTPFHHRNLDADAEEFLENWALEFPQNSHFRIIVHIEHMVRTATKSDVAVLLITFLLTVFGDLVIAVNIGVLLTCLLFMKRMSEAIVIEQHTYEKLRLETDNKDFKLPPKTVVFAIEGPFFFGAAQHLDHALESIHGHAEILVLRLAKVPFIDATAMQSLWDLLAHCQRHNTRLVLCEARPNVIHKLKIAGLIDVIGKENLLEHINQINRYEPTR